MDRGLAEDDLEEHAAGQDDDARAARRQRQRGHAEEQHEEDREALLLEELDEAAERVRALAAQPVLELVADLQWRVRHSAIRAKSSGGAAAGRDGSSSR